MKSELRLSEGLIREIDVEIPVETVDSAFKEIYERIRKEARVKGFRPGKAPLNIVRTMFRKEAQDEVAENLIKDTYPEAIKEHKLKVASLPDFKKHDFAEGKPLKYTARIEVMPEVGKVDIENLELPQIEIEVLDPEVDAVVEHLRKRNAEFKVVERVSGDNDIVFMDLTKLEDSAGALKENELKDLRIDLASDMTVKEFKEGLKGVKAGDEKEIEVNYPEHYSARHLAGKKIKYLCRINSVKERILPPEDDYFAKSQGDFATILELRLQIRKDLKKEKELDHKSWEKDAIIRQLLTKNPIPVPEGLVEKYLESLAEDARKQDPKIDVKLFKQYRRDEAVNAIRWSFLMDKLTEDEKIALSPSDTDNWIREFARKYKMDLEKAKEMLSQSGRIESVRESLLENKLIDFLRARVKYVPISLEAGESAGAAETKADNQSETIKEGN